MSDFSLVIDAACRLSIDTSAMVVDYIQEVIVMFKATDGPHIQFAKTITPDRLRGPETSESEEPSNLADKLAHWEECYGDLRPCDIKKFGQLYSSKLQVTA